MKLTFAEQLKFSEFDNFVINFSGGIDSCASLLWVKENFPAKNIIAIYCNISVTLPTVRNFVLDFCIKTKTKYKILKVPNFLDILPQKGWPKWRFPWCKKLLINDYIDAFVKNNFSPEKTLRIIGGNIKQAPRRINRYQWTKIGSYKVYNSVFYSDRSDLIQYIKNKGFDIWNGYKLGFPRTACWCCPGQSCVQMYLLKRYYPNLFEKFHNLEIEYGKCLFKSMSGKKPFMKTAEEWVLSGERKYKRLYKSDIR